MTETGAHQRQRKPITPPLTIGEINDIITNLDSDFVATMHTLGNNSHIARGFIQGGAYLFSNSTNKGKTDIDRASLTGNKPTLCVKN
ncbi:MAG: hypothetical protein ACK5NL_04495 [Vibrio fluvialis]